MENWYKAEVNFLVNGRPVKFEVVHNIPDFMAALENWIHRTNNYTAKSLCNYVNGKQTDHTYLTMKQFNKLNK